MSAAILAAAALPFFTGDSPLFLAAMASAGDLSAKFISWSVLDLLLIVASFGLAVCFCGKVHELSKRIAAPLQHWKA